MIKAIIFSILFISQLSLKAEFMPMAIQELIVKSEKIVYGEIVNLDSTHFEIKIEGSLTGDSGTLRIRKFENWTCAWRWTEYKKGQNLLLFLHTWNNELVSMGAGNEGELPINNNEIHINSLSLMYINGDQNDWENTDFTFPGNQFNIHDGEFHGTKMKLGEFLETTTYIRQCLNFEYGKYHQESNWKFKCKIAEMENKSNSSLLIKAILREAKERNNER